MGGPAAALGLLLAACVGPPGLRGTGDPLVITEAASAPPASSRAEAVAEMRAEAEAVPAEPEFSTARLAERPEPRSATEVAAIEAELELIAQRRATSVDGEELAALEARAKELKRLVAAAQAGPLRR